MITIFLVCAVLASLAAGVLTAYGVCVAMFALLASQSSQPAAFKRPAPATASSN